MATSTTKSGAKKTTSTSKKTTTAAKTQAVEKESSVASVAEPVVQEEPVKTVSRKDVDLDQLIPVLNGFQGRLLYRSPRTNELLVWPEFGDEQMMELKELRNAKNTWKVFFANNWFMFDEEHQWVIDYLGVRQYYKNALGIDNFDDLFSKSPEEITEIISGLSDGQKKSAIQRARTLVAEDAIDSNRAITALETSLGIELKER